MTLVMVSPDGHRIEVPQRSVCRVGRNALNDVVLAHPTVAQFHCAVDFQRARPVIRDLGSPCGIFLNGASPGLTDSELSDGDSVRIGGLTFEVRLLLDESSQFTPRD